MLFDRFSSEDIDPFLAMSGKEGWICDQWEFEFLLQRFPNGCFVIRDAGGSPLAFVTAIAYASSGWIGNLIVHEEMRRKGLGLILMEKAMDALSDVGVRTIWLTASPKGAPLYARMGFKAIDRIGRWMIERSVEVNPPDVVASRDIQELITLDQAGWGDDRGLICHEKSRLGTLRCDKGSYLVVHENASVSQIGPWASDSAVNAEHALDRLYSGKTRSGKTLLDVPSGNNNAVAMLVKRGFMHCSETVLMYYGNSAPFYRADKIFALASLGSIG